MSLLQSSGLDTVSYSLFPDALLQVDDSTSTQFPFFHILEYLGNLSR